MDLVFLLIVFFFTLFSKPIQEKRVKTVEKETQKCHLLVLKYPQLLNLNQCINKVILDTAFQGPKTVNMNISHIFTGTNILRLGNSVKVQLYTTLKARSHTGSQMGKLEWQKWLCLQNA